MIYRKRSNINSRFINAFSVVGLLFLLFQTSPAQTPTPNAISSSSLRFVAPGGQSIESLIESANNRRADLMAARQRLAIAQGRLTQSGSRPNPVFESEYSSPRFLGGENEGEFSAGVTQTFELGGKRGKRVAVARLELEQTQAEVFAIEREVAAGVRKVYAKAIAAARQLDVIEKLLAYDAELIRVTEARLSEGDVAPLDVNLVKVESDRLRVQRIEALSTLETAVLDLRLLTGFDVDEPLVIAPQSDRPPLLDKTLSELTSDALRDRFDLQAARIGEKLGSAKLSLAKSEIVPDIDATVGYSRNKGIIDLPASAGGGMIIDRENALRFGISVELPVFNRHQGEIAAATSEQVQASRQREFLEATIKRDVATAYRRYRAAAEKLVIYSTQIIPKAEANLQTVRAAYGLGDFSIFEVVAEQRRLNENITGFNQVLEEYYVSLADLESAIGTPLAPDAFTPGSTSVIPSQDAVPVQFDREQFLKSLRINSAVPVGSSKNEILKPKTIPQEEK